jgi:hypothetical protein
MNKMDANTGILKWGNIAAFAITIVVNSLAGVGLINGISTAAISDIYSTLITPAGYVFSIWGVIYILLGVFVVFQALPIQNGKTFHKQISYLFVLSSVCNIVWIFLWQYKYITLSVIAIFALLITLIMIYLHLGIGKSSVSSRERLAVHLPFSTYLGWITIATIADVAAALVSVNWNGLGLSPTNWAILVIVVALAIISLVIVTRRDIAYSLVAIWALIGIAVNQSGYPNVAATAEISAIIVAVVLVGRVLVFRGRH